MRRPEVQRLLLANGVVAADSCPTASGMCRAFPTLDQVRKSLTHPPFLHHYFLSLLSKCNNVFLLQTGLYFVSFLQCARDSDPSQIRISVSDVCLLIGYCYRWSEANSRSEVQSTPAHP